MTDKCNCLHSFCITAYNQGHLFLTAVQVDVFFLLRFCGLVLQVSIQRVTSSCVVVLFLIVTFSCVVYSAVCKCEM